MLLQDGQSPVEDCCPNPVFVRLTREDILLQAISLWKARISNSYHSYVPLENKPQYNSDAIERIMFEIMYNSRRWDAYFMRNDIRPLQISYEQLQKSPGDLIEKIADLVQIPIDTKNLLEPRIMTVQRDEETLAWRQKFCSEKKDLNRLDLPASPNP